MSEITNPIESDTGKALRVSAVTKRFGGTVALDGVSIAVEHGQVLALLGHNGSGKSTLIKILAGFHQPDGDATGSVDGETFVVGSAEDAAHAGLRFVHQDLGIIAELDAIDNVALVTGYARTRAGRIDRGAMIRRTQELLDVFEIDLDVTALLIEATPVQRTAVAIARALWDWDQDAARVLVLDEPTAALPSKEVDHLFDLVRSVTAAGHGVVYVTHRMDEVFRVAQDVVVLRSGRVVASSPVTDLTPRRLTELIVGDSAVDLPVPGVAGEETAAAEATPAEGAAPVLRVRGLNGLNTRNVDLAIMPGEIVGLAGLQGSGRDELPYLLVGALPADEGAEWERQGRPVPAPSMAGAVDQGLAFVPAERSREGLVSEFNVRENLTLAQLPRLGGGTRFSVRRERDFASSWLDEMGISSSVLEQPIGTLSGGNQQRVLLAKWFCTDPDLLVVSEPTAGVDAGARQAIYSLLRDRASRGLGIVIASSDVDDLVEVCSRVLVLRHGEIVASFQGVERQRRDILELMEVSDA